MQLAGSTFAYKTRLQPTVAMSQQRPSVWQRVIRGRCLSLFAVSYMTLMSRRKHQHVFTRTTKAQSAWATPKNRLLELDTWMFAILLWPNGLNETSSPLLEWIPKLMLRKTLQKIFLIYSFTNMMMCLWGTSHLRIVHWIELALA